MNHIWILLGSSYDLLEERRKDDVTILFLFIWNKQIPCRPGFVQLLSVIDHRRFQNMVRTCVIHLVAPCLPFILFLSHFDVICDLLLDRYTCKMESFVKLILSNEFLVTDDFHLWSRFSNLINWLSSILDLQCKQKELLRIHRLSHSINFLSQEKVNLPTKMDLSMRDLSTNIEDMVKENGS